MKLAIFSHKPVWRSAASPTGFATDGGFPFQVAALSELFDETDLVVPVYANSDNSGEIPLKGAGLRVVPLAPPFGAGATRKLLFPLWLIWAAGSILKTFCKADAVHAPIPGDVGTVGMLLAWIFGKPLFVRHCGNWMCPKTLPEKFWRWFMESSAVGRNVMLATGGAEGPPSGKNPNVRWIFSTSLTENELNRFAFPRSYPPQSQFRLIIVARQEESKGAGLIIRALIPLAKTFPGVSLDIVGQGSAVPGFKLLAARLGVDHRVRFLGKLNHEQVMHRLRDAHLFVFPTTSSDGFPKAVLESLASGLPVVATRVSVLPKLIGSGGGILLDEATPDEVARGIANGLSDPAGYEAMSRAAISTAQQYSLEAWRDQIGTALQSAWGPMKRTRVTNEAEAVGLVAS